MKTIFGYSLHKVLIIIGGIFLLLAAITLIISLVKSRMDRNDPKKTVQDIEKSQNTSVITASVFFAFAIVLVGTGLYMYLRQPCHAPAPEPSPPIGTDEQLIDDKIKEGWFLQTEDSKQSDPAKDPCVVNKDNLADWGLKHGTDIDPKDCDGEGWVLRKNTRTYRYNPERARTVNYRGLRVLLNENIPGLGGKKATESPAFFA